MKNQILEYLSEPLALTDDNGNIVAHVVFNDVNCILDKSDKCLQCTMTSEIVQQRNIKESEYNIEHIDRGYENIEEKFRKLGANIQRVTE